MNNNNQLDLLEVTPKKALLVQPTPKKEPTYTNSNLPMIRVLPNIDSNLESKALALLKSLPEQTIKNMVENFDLAAFEISITNKIRKANMMRDALVKLTTDEHWVRWSEDTEYATLTWSGVKAMGLILNFEIKPLPVRDGSDEEYLMEEFYDSNKVKHYKYTVKVWGRRIEKDMFGNVIEKEATAKGYARTNDRFFSSWQEETGEKWDNGSPKKIKKDHSGDEVNAIKDQDVMQKALANGAGKVMELLYAMKKVHKSILEGAGIKWDLIPKAYHEKGKFNKPTGANHEVTETNEKKKPKNPNEPASDPQLKAIAKISKEKVENSSENEKHIDTWLSKIKFTKATASEFIQFLNAWEAPCVVNEWIQKIKTYE